ncbi:MAG TPA: DegT/DnrJ/EryC1/StrS family aminotransferase [Arenimonas sp.]|uniref:DegT/DnrJ/EryC1/StrS family aminotransferase n=1 Tax=Arenimonas sp. TaxID=1872635 RepID=UPI002C32B0EA|nr:DegT/DnrJ/EryC1/StrS family aminotransferase [Arenimonas sp.]HMB55780.1 DegT/DnrJ/EryC1/StrS family aminotransferase [Arenimonas sp.]
MASDIAMFDAPALHGPLLAELEAAAAAVFRHGRFILGPEVAELETRLADYVGVRHCITCGSGTTALIMALMALGIGSGDEVILPAFTFAAPIEVVLLLGATPVLADIEAGTHALSPASVATLIGARTRAIIAVSLYGQPADFPALQALTRDRGIALIEDGAQSFGSTLAGVRSGAFGDMSCSSFFPTKPLGGCGDGGAVFTGDDALATALREIRDHGQTEKYRHTRLGLNGRLDSLACAALLVKFRHFPAHLQRRQQLAARYDQGLAGIATPVVRADVVSAYGQYCLELDARESVREALARAGIATAIHYPACLHQQPAFQSRCLRAAALPQAERLAWRGLCLPLHPTLSDSDQDRVIATLTDMLG